MWDDWPGSTCHVRSVYAASSQAITIKLHNDSDTEDDPPAATSSGVNLFRRTSTGLLSNRPPLDGDDDVAKELHERLLLRNESTKKVVIETIYRESDEAKHNVQVWTNANDLASARPLLKKVSQIISSATIIRDDEPRCASLAGQRSAFHGQVSSSRGKCTKSTLLLRLKLQPVSSIANNDSRQVTFEFRVTYSIHLRGCTTINTPNIAARRIPHIALAEDYLRLPLAGRFTGPECVRHCGPIRQGGSVRQTKCLFRD